MLFYVLFVLCRSVYCLCVNVYCTVLYCATATGSGDNPIAVNKYIISYGRKKKMGHAAYKCFHSKFFLQETDYLLTVSMMSDAIHLWTCAVYTYQIRMTTKST